MDVHQNLLSLLMFAALIGCHPLRAQTATDVQAVAGSESTANKAANKDTTSNPAAGEQPPPDWATDLLADDPLAAKESITLQDLEQALTDESQRRWVIERHFLRAALTPQQQDDFLRAAFQHPDSAVRQQVAAALQQLGQLEDFVRDMLLAWIRDGDQSAAEAAMIGLQFLPIPKEKVDQRLLDSLLRALASESPTIRAAAAQQLERLGPAAIPILLEAMQDPEQPWQEAAEVLSRIVGDVPEKPGRQEKRPATEEALPPSAIIKSAPSGPVAPILERKVDEQDAQVVRVYYGTNRVIAQHPSDPKRALTIWGIVSLSAVLFALWSFARRRREVKSTLFFYVVRRLVTAVLLIAVIVFAVLKCDAAVRQLMSARGGVQFGGRRSADSTIYFGFCDVSIPPTHSVGVVERPLIGPEDETRHVVLQQAVLLEQAAFYSAINQVLSGLGDTSRDCLLYVHGYNVAFDDAALRAAQIHHDLNFAGTTMFYSWPSRASFHHYFSDRNEIRFSHRLIKEFLAGILKNVDVDRFHIIGHSMGADALCQAILELDPEGEVFDQIILAAPDIDADVFKQQILPRLQRCGSRTTLYCSKKDWALHASKHFNDSLRAGDSSNGPLVATGLDTIDASEMDTELLGHSYYGNCLPLLDDLRLLIEQNRPPEQRKLEPLFVVPEIPYWIFTETL